jgi:hypothetical protein
VPDDLPLHPVLHDVLHNLESVFIADNHPTPRTCRPIRNAQHHYRKNRRSSWALLRLTPLIGVARRFMPEPPQSNPPCPRKHCP